MSNHLEEFLQILREQEKEEVIHLSDPEDLYRFDLRFKLMHQKFSLDRVLRGAQLLIEELN